MFDTVPLFFGLNGFRTNLGLLRARDMGLVFGLVIAVAVAGKLGGATVAARLSGFGWRDAAAVGTLVNTRGLMEVVVLNVGLDLGILRPALFTIMVLMAILTTLMTAPLLRWLRPPSLSVALVRFEQRDPAPSGPVPG